MAKSTAKKAQKKKAAATQEDGPICGDSSLAPTAPNGAPEGRITHFNPKFSYQVLDKDNQATINTSIKLLSELGTRRKTRPSDFKTLSQVRAQYLPAPHFAQQYMLGCIGIPHCSMLTITGPEAVGKTTLTMEVIGWAMWLGCQGVYISTDSKDMPVDRACRALSNNRSVAEAMAERMLWTRAHSLPEFEQKLHDVINTLRGRHNKKNEGVNIPLDTPIVVACDLFSSLMSKQEAEGFYGYGKTAEKLAKEDFTESDGGSNLTHARWAWAFGRRLPALLMQNNIILIIVNSQTEKIDMGAKSFMPAEVGVLYNKNSRASKALSARAAIQLIMASIGQYKVSDEVRGKNVAIRAAKQSFGPEGRKLVAVLNTEMVEDRIDYLQPALDFDHALANILIEHKLFGLAVENKRYSSKELGLYGATARELAIAFHARSDLVMRAGQILRIEGYASIVDQAIAEAEANKAPVQPTAMRLEGNLAPEPPAEAEDDAE